ncbi:pyridoxal phosphate-dependent aminotransferase [Desulfopila sp. IMCC35006]|uniref:pyridoxal phosphate-dependent aminotransferase n=1 Tax=Desulfopila sp. IMCC35006 TaxID=2569542 RepID=UPI0010AC4E97|nr:pyridoxal phosphate-dependent aminotransferase [Desulfopila sp. IMCC35006]TKB26525.1 pyridoxal phosphate-dependent aminotransferase [Desulfopila sp. IMCC35006]
MAISDKMRMFAEKSSWIRKMFEEGAKMKAAHGTENVCDFSLGNPDAPPPPEYNRVIQEIVQDTSPGVHSYMPNGGYPWVREALAARMSVEQKMTIGQGDTLMTCGAAGGLNVVMKTLLNPGDEVIILAPYFVEYGFYIDNHGGVSKTVKTDAEFNLDLSAIEAALSDKTKAIIINSPNNPCGQIYSEQSLAALGELLEAVSAKLGTTIYLISDEPYRKIVFDDHEVPSIFTAYTNSIVVSSYSKDLSLPGERIGYMAVHPHIEEKPQLLDGLTLANRILGFVNAPALMQRVVAELQDVTVDTTIYSRRKEIICTVLREAGFTFTEPKGAFYVFPRTPLADDVKFVALLQEQKILAVPGVGFGSPGHMRIAFCVPDEVITRSADGFKKAVAKARSL